jgi:hypothetical protein
LQTLDFPVPPLALEEEAEEEEEEDSQEVVEVAPV